jgi:hypothetical protein
VNFLSQGWIDQSGLWKTFPLATALSSRTSRHVLGKFLRKDFAGGDRKHLPGRHRTPAGVVGNDLSAMYFLT